MVPDEAAPANRRVAAIAYDGLCTFEFGIVIEMFALPRPELPVEWYDFRVCARVWLPESHAFCCWPS